MHLPTHFGFGAGHLQQTSPAFNFGLVGREREAFMDRIGDSAKKGLDFIKSRALETVEVQKLSSVVKELEERRNQCLLDLGHRVVACYGTEELKDEVFQDRVEEVHALTEKLESAQTKYEETKAHLRHSMEDLIPGRPQPPIPSPDYEDLS
jgi:hypothetical protein